MRDTGYAINSFKERTKRAARQEKKKKNINFVPIYQSINKIGQCISPRHVLSRSMRDINYIEKDVRQLANIGNLQDFILDQSPSLIAIEVKSGMNVQPSYVNNLKVLNWRNAGEVLLNS